MKILALDQSSRTTGYAIFEAGVLLTSGTFTVSNPDLGERLVKIRQTVEKLVDENGVDKVAFEDIQLQNNVPNNVATYKILSEVLGVVQEFCAEREMPYEIVHSQTWKSALNIKGRTRPEQKKNAQKYVLDTYSLKVSQDESDAICIGTYAMNNADLTIW